MHVLFIIDPLPGFSAWKDTSLSMMQALVARGHTISVTEIKDMFIDAGEVRCLARAISLVDGADLHGTDWWRDEGEPQDSALQTFDAVLMRKDPPFDLEYFYATHMLDLAASRGARVFNSGAALRDHPEKLAIMEFSQFTAPTLVSRDMARLRAFHAQHGDIVVKPLDGMGGTGVFRITAQDGNLGAILEMLTDYGARSIMAQRYIPDITRGDKRILIIDGKPMPYSLARIPQPGETRGNLAAGGEGVAQPLTERDLEIAQAIGPRLVRRGLLLIGLDVIGDYLTEINVTSPTCFVEIAQQTDCNVALHFALALEKAVGLEPG